MNALGYQKRTSKSKTNIRKNAWKKKVQKHVVRSLFLAREALKSKPEVVSQGDTKQTSLSGSGDDSSSSVSQ